VRKTDLAKLFRSAAGKCPLKAPGVVRRTEAAELLEFALALPIILVMLVGLLDFATAYHLKQRLANAAREGARVASGLDHVDITNPGVPATVQTIKDDVTTYLLDAGVNTAFIGSTGTNVGNFTWTFYSTGTYGVKIERAYTFTDSTGKLITANRVTITCPYNWTYGFNHIIRFLIPSATGSGTITITTDATMPWIG
jgi:Flp pilus assembly protein TadG